MIKKNEIVEIEIIKNEYPGVGMALYDNTKIYVKNAIVGQVLKVRIRKKRRRCEGEVVEVLRQATNETVLGCAKFGICGGCTYQSISYEDELKIKEGVVLDLFNKAGITDFDFLGIEGSPEEKFYRNKMEYSFGDKGKDSELSLGLRKRNNYYEVAYPQGCNIADSDFMLILTTVLEFFKKTNEKFYHRTRHDGTLRYLVIRKGKRTGEILINLVTTDTMTQNLDILIEILTTLSLKGRIIGIVRTINNSLADAVKCDRLEILYGRDYFFEVINELRFKISTFSFFQTNSLAAEMLYKTIKSFIPDRNGIVFDLYCGTGTIAQVVSRNARQVIGIELSDEAVSAAIENTNINSIENCSFIAGDVLAKVSELELIPETIILDPPRDGLNPRLTDKIISLEAQHIVYVSCKPTSLVRDLQIFIDNGYALQKIKLHDLFPRTWHVESVVLMSKRGS